jgi:hypothetical protein
MRRPVCAAVALALVLTAGCRGPLNVETTVHLDPVDSSKPLLIDPPTYDQQVTVTVSSPVEVDAYLVLEKDRKAAEDALAAGKKPTAVLDEKEKATEATLTGKVPGKTASAVVFSNARKTGDAKVKIVGK